MLVISVCVSSCLTPGSIHHLFCEHHVIEALLDVESTDCGFYAFGEEAFRIGVEHSVLLISDGAEVLHVVLAVIGIIAFVFNYNGIVRAVRAAGGGHGHLVTVEGVCHHTFTIVAAVDDNLRKVRDKTKLKHVEDKSRIYGTGNELALVVVLELVGGSNGFLVICFHRSGLCKGTVLTVFIGGLILIAFFRSDGTVLIEAGHVAVFVGNGLHALGAKLGAVPPVGVFIGQGILFAGYQAECCCKCKEEELFHIGQVFG